MRITIIQPRRSEDGLSIMTPAGSPYTVSDAFGTYMVRAGFATDTDNALYVAPNTGGGLSPEVAAKVPALVSGAWKQVATNCYFPNTLVGSAKQFNSRTPHFMRGDGCTSLQLAYANWVSDSTESLPGAPMTVEATIEYPAGTVTRVTWAGGNVCTIADGAAGALSDAAAVAIPRGAKFWVRTFAQNANGVPFYSWPTAVAGTTRLAADYGTSGLANKVLSGTIGTPSSIAVYPQLIVAMSSRPAVLIHGDSIAAGYTDTQDDESVDLGVVARVVSPQHATILAVHPGTTAAQWVAGSSRRRAMVLPYVSSVISQHGFNDLGDAGTAASLLAVLAQLPALAPGKSYYQTTITPKSTSTDSWATVANQTAVNLAARTAVNMAARSGLPGFEGHLDICAAVESSFDSGKFRVDLGVPAPDGIHPNLAINAWIRRSGAVSVALIR